MTVADKIIEANRLHPDWNDRQICEAVGCTRQYVRIIAHRHKLKRPPLPPAHHPKHMVMCNADPELKAWIDEEARRMGPGIRAGDVVLAILRDARAGD